MKTPPLNTKLRTYDEFDCEDNPALKGELTLMFGQLAIGHPSVADVSLIADALNGFTIV